MKKKLVLCLLMICACMFLTGCGCSRKEYTITFDTAGGSSVSTQVIKKGDKVTKPADPTKEGYTFVGWYLNLNDIQSYDFSKEVTGDVKLIAKWVSGTVCNLSCGEGYTLDTVNCACVKNSDVKEVTSISVDRSSISLVVGKSTTIKATVKPADATNQAFTWSSSDTSIATVDENGKITAVKVGTAKITVKAGDKSKTITVTVKTQDKYNLDNVSLSAKTLTKGGVSISDYKASGCTITLKSATPSNNKTTVASGTVTHLFVNSKAEELKATYEVKCGSESKTVNVTHKIPASKYKYTVNTGSLIPMIVISGASKYTLQTEDGQFTGIKDSGKGAQFPDATKNYVYLMQFDNDAKTTYRVVKG